MDSKLNWTQSKRTEVIRWLSIAIKDRGLAGLAVSQGYLENDVYNFQQSAEKLLKAFLLANDILPKKTHNIDGLLLVAAKVDTAFLDFNIVGIGSSRMTELATYYRYPNLDENDYAQLDEVEGAIKFTDSLYKHLKTFFGEEILEDAKEHARQKINHFEDSISEILHDENFANPKKESYVAPRPKN